jgi:hypothetical protein
MASPPCARVSASVSTAVMVGAVATFGKERPRRGATSRSAGSTSRRAVCRAHAKKPHGRCAPRECRPRVAASCRAPQPLPQMLQIDIRQIAVSDHRDEISQIPA